MIPAGLAVSGFGRLGGRNGARRLLGIARGLLRRGLLLGLGAVLLAVVSLVLAAPARAQAAHQKASDQKAGIEGTWQGTLHIPQQKDLRTVVKITKDAGALKATFYSIDQGAGGIPISSIAFQDGELKFGIDAIDGTYDGKMSPDGKSIAGQWKQGNPLALVLERTTPDTAWTIPEPPKRQPPMAADADPSFEVATVKPSAPDEQGKGFRWDGARFSTVNTTLVDLIKFSYGVQEKQVLGGPAWMSTDKFDLAGKPDIPGSPDDRQLKSMVRKLLADRFGLKFHRDTKELSAYVLSVGKNGPKMKKPDADAGNLPGLFFRGLGVLTVTNATMVDFCGLMQEAVLDRPVVDHTNIAGRWNFLLKWTPDQSQFAGMGVKVPPPSDTPAADAPPPLFTAIQEQVGLRLEAEKAQVEVLVLDHIERPSGN